jgi:K+-transporting ATPase ATPase C chain
VVWSFFNISLGDSGGFTGNLPDPIRLPGLDFSGSIDLDGLRYNRNNMELRKLIRPAALLLIFFTILLGVIYPILITGISQIIFPFQANGSIIEKNGKPVGSALIGQNFQSAKYFWGRPSATSGSPYTPFDPVHLTGSSGSNLGQLSRNLITDVQHRVDFLRSVDPINTLPIPVDLVTASGSGLDPDISIDAAYYQIPRVALARGISETELKKFIDQHVENKILSSLGLSYVNVLELNLTLDDIQ